MTYKSSSLKWFCAFAILFSVSNRTALAVPRCYAPDDELVQRSDSIVIGHVQSSFEPFEFPSNRTDNYHYLEYRATLIVTETIAGNVQVGPTPLIIHYGIKPVVLKTTPSIQDTFNSSDADQNTDSTTPVGIYDSATSCIGGPPTDDIRKDHIWFLRVQGRSIGGIEEDTSSPGIWSPQDVQSLGRKAYYLAIVSGDIDGITPFTLGDSYPAKSALSTQNRMKIMRIAKIADLSARCDQLLPFYVAHTPYSSASQLAFDQIIACGSVGAAKLVPLFESTDDKLERGTILGGWQKVDFKESIPVIIDWLTKEDQWWSAENNDDFIFAIRESYRGGATYTDSRSVSLRNLRSAIGVLGNFHAQEAVPIIRQIKNRWQTALPVQSNDGFLQACDNALAELK